MGTGYASLKLIHVTAVALTFCGFVARGVGVLSGADWTRSRLARTLPHVVDTVLLLSALGMLWIARLAPWAAPWLMAKLVGLLLYIALGSVALRRRREPRAIRRVAWVGALVVFAYIVSVAVTKSPLGALAWIGCRNIPNSP